MSSSEKPAYIAFLDLLGTKSSCKDSSIYFELISDFSKAVRETSWNLEAYGQVGIFSDSAYAESSDLEHLLDFLVQLRIRLIAKKVFFNAVVKKGELGSRDLKEGSHLFGVTFSGNDIAELYISQTAFKGIGIYIDKSVEDEVSSTKYVMNDCIFVGSDYDEQSKKNKYYPVPYKDISFDKTIRYQTIKNLLLETVLGVMYSSYLESPKYGRYYISILSNLLRSDVDGIEWNKAQQKFIEMPTPFSAIYKMLVEHYSKLSDLPGIEYLAFILLDIVYNSNKLSIEDQISITKLFAEYECIKSKYIHSLNKIPDVLFTNKHGQASSNKELFVQYCKNDMSRDFVENIMK